MGEVARENLWIYNACQAVPEEAKRPIMGGRMKGKTDINPMWRIKTLTDLFGPCGIGWYYKTTNKWLERCGDEVAAFVDIELFVKVDGEWSMPISGTGGSSFATKEKTGVFVSDECYKMATTDAISVSCKQLGIGADVYWQSDTSKYGKPEEQKTLDARYINSMTAELARTGIGLKQFIAAYHVSDIRLMTVEQYKDAMEKLKTKPDRPIDKSMVPPSDLDDARLPWNDAGA